MNNPYQLFLHRVKKEWNYHYSVWKTAIDWIVWLYVLLPILAVFCHQYYFIWSGQAQWLHSFPTEFSWFIFFFLSTKGTVRLFLQEADLLFLRQNKHWLETVMRFGITYSLFLNALQILILSAVFFPVWYIYEGATFSKIITFISFVYFFRLSLQFTKQMLTVTFQNWKLLLINITLILISFFIFITYLLVSLPIQLIINVLFIIAVLILYKVRLNMKWCFNEDCLRETQERLKLTSLFIAASGYKVEKGKQKRKKPLILFSNSAYLFSNRTNSNLITETYIKFVLRNKATMILLFQITMISLIAIVLVPFSVKWLLVFICSFSVNHLIKSSWKEVKGHSFFKLLPHDDHDMVIIAVKKAIFLLASPSIFLFGFYTGWSVFSPFIGLLVGILIVILNYIQTKRTIWLD
ncbi:MAG: ABC transporter permease [Anaerobacillus sp.]|uniref:ABC transporter permease n=1 Tax=Anaerobacillus sp. TaxID=1872506 RepID=UPI00391CA17A